MAEGCPIIGNDGVYGQVTTVMNNMWGNAQAAFDVALEGLQELGSFSLTPITISSHLAQNSNWWTVLRPQGPARPNLDWIPDYDVLPEAPNSDTGGAISFDAPPTFNETAPTLPNRVAPGALTAGPPAGPPALDTVVVPDAPVLELPVFPQLREIVLPDPPSIQIPTFQGVRPTFSVSVPQNNFGFEAEHYSSALLDKIRQRISVMVDGKPGLPDAAARQMRDRAYSAVDQQGLRAEQEAIEEFASRGFSEPDGVLRRKLAEVRQNNQNQRNALSRDIYLRDVEIAVEDLRFAVAQGVVLEGQQMGNFLATQQLMLDAAKTGIKVAIDIANIEIAIANLDLQAYQTDAQVHRDLIQAELAEIEVYRAELEGKKLIGELNQQDVAILAERVRLVLAEIEIYTAHVTAAKTKADVNIARTQAFGEQVKAYSALVDAKATEWDAFAKATEADLARYRRYELATQVFGNRVRIWGEINGNKIDQKRLRISERELDLSAYRARLEKFDAVWRAANQRLDAKVRVYGADIDKYRADAAVESIISEGRGRQFQLALEQETNRVQMELRNAELRITQAQQIGTLMERKLETISQVAAQLAAGMASAMSVHAGISSSLGQSSSCSTSFSYSANLE